MTTATPAHSKHHQHADPHGGHGTAPRAIDPDHDIDAKKTVIVLVTSAIFVFASVAVLYVVFSLVMHGQMVSRVEQSPTTQRDELRAYEDKLLGPGDEPKRKSIDDSIRELTPNK